MPNESGHYNVKEASAFLGISRNSLSIAIRAREVESFRRGKYRLITADELAAYAQRRLEKVRGVQAHG